ncbi:tRNA (5-methylaminomethyl-2-thiouridine)(34)-methyltransferase MnmD [Moraxella cuniculi]|nr:tRNA (5-methylaminomethyl-2-thiouridine)(34)-methyltransferase MnmD [Moraxella cuniculi]
MTNHHQSMLSTATISWQTDHHGNRVPISTQFDDVYFSQAGGLDETHHVFFQGNRLPERFAALDEQECFVIGETGFGTGLNFLATCQLWQTLAPKTAKLHFISTEKFPLSRHDLAHALSAWQHTPLAAWISILLDNYPLLIAGCHRLHISDTITLDLWFQDATESLHGLLATQQQQRIDAWFLDGFTPNKNSDMWQPPLFAAMAGLSHAQTTLATFTAAGFVRRSLLDAGFDVVKGAGFGRKRDMLHSANEPYQPKFPKKSLKSPAKNIAIIGGGISGVSMAMALLKRGHFVTIFDKNPLMSGASGNPCALLAPKLTISKQVANHLPTASFLYSYRHYKALTKYSQVIKTTGVIDLLLPSQKSAQKRQQLIDEYPDELIQTLKQSSYQPPVALEQDMSNADIAAFVRMGSVLYPANIAKILNNDLANYQRFSYQNYNINNITECDDGVNLATIDRNFHFDSVVICAGFASHLLHEHLFNCRKIRGQISWVSANHYDDIAPAVKYEGYCSHFVDSSNQKPYLLFGASFVRNSTDTAVYHDEHLFNYQKLNQSLPQYCQLQQINEDTQFYGRAAIRAQTPDYHPVVGKVPHSKHSYCLYGLGSKGFGFAPFCAEILAEMIDGGILPVERGLLDKISPSRTRLQTPLDESK